MKQFQFVTSSAPTLLEALSVLQNSVLELAAESIKNGEGSIRIDSWQAIQEVVAGKLIGQHQMNTMVIAHLVWEEKEIDFEAMKAASTANGAPIQQPAAGKMRSI